MKFDSVLIDQYLNEIFPLPQHFGISYLKEDGLGIMDTLLEKLTSLDPGVTIDYGISKMVIISPILDVVIKIPFSGYFNDDFDEEATDDYWNDFLFAEEPDHNDYCFSEYRKYRTLKKKKLNCFVAKTVYYTTIDGVRIFLQEKVTPCAYLKKDSYKPSVKSYKIASNLCKENSLSINLEWTANCIDKYGKHKVKKFLSYCRDVDTNILADMHSGNFGYRKDGTPVLLDFSNYLE